MLIAGPFLEQAAEAGDPAFAVGRRRRQYALGEAGFLQDLDLHAVKFFAAEVRRINRVRIDHDGVDAGSPEHRGRGGAREPAADYRNICRTHRIVSSRRPSAPAPQVGKIGRLRLRAQPQVNLLQAAQVGERGRSAAP